MSRAQGQKNKKSRTVKTCPCCGKKFEIFSGESEDKQFCDRACYYAFKTGVTRTDWLLEHGRYTNRKCHKCGKPTTQYWCTNCRNERIRNAGSDELSSAESYGAPTSTSMSW